MTIYEAPFSRKQGTFEELKQQFDSFHAIDQFWFIELAKELSNRPQQHDFTATHGAEFQSQVEAARESYWQGEGELEPAPPPIRTGDHPYYCPGEFE